MGSLYTDLRSCYHSYLVCIILGMPSLHLVTFLLTFTDKYHVSILACPRHLKPFVHGACFSTLPVPMQHTPQLFATLCGSLGCGCFVEVGYAHNIIRCYTSGIARKCGLPEPNKGSFATKQCCAMCGGLAGAETIDPQ